MFHVGFTEAEMVKYTKNNFYALKVIFANQMHDICTAMGIEWSKIRDIITTPQDQPIGDSHLEPMMGLMRGFGGKCLPKDTLALRELARSLGVDYDLLDAIQSDNASLEESLQEKHQTYLRRMIDAGVTRFFSKICHDCVGQFPRALYLVGIICFNSAKWELLANRFMGNRLVSRLITSALDSQNMDF